MTTTSDYLTNLQSDKNRLTTAFNLDSSLTFTEIAEKAENGEIGGGGTVVEEKDVNFFDYDGTLVDSYTTSEFANLTTLPNNPSHEGLTAQGWNWTLSDAQNYVATYGGLSIGQLYVTDDNSIRLYVSLQEGRLNPYISYSMNGRMTIDWGDGYTETKTSTQGVTVSHEYSQAGDYVIKLKYSLSSGDLLIIGTGLGLCSGLFYKGLETSGSASENRIYNECLKKVELGSRVRLRSYALANCGSLESVSIPQDLKMPEANTMQNCASLKYITLPSSVTLIGETNFDASGLENISLPNTITTINQRAFRNCKLLKKLYIPSSTTTLGNQIAYTCPALEVAMISNNVNSMGTQCFFADTSLKKTNIPTSLTTLPVTTFNQCLSLSALVIPNTLTSIGNSAFYYCFGLSYLDFSSFTSIPTLGTNSISVVSDTKIIVPDDLYDDWKVATNWSNLASYIIKKSEWDGSGNANS